MVMKKGDEGDDASDVLLPTLLNLSDESIT